MDLLRVKARGRSRTGKRWLTDPLRLVAWQLGLPYYDGVLKEVAGAITPIAERAHQTDEAVAGLRQEIGSLQAEIEGLRGDLAAALRIDVTAGIRKDIAAISHRLASFEERVPHDERLAARIAAAVVPATDQAAAALAKAGAAEAYAAVIHQEARTTSEVLRGSVDGASRRIAEVESRAGALRERIDAIAHGAPLRAGDRIALGTGNLVLTSTLLGTRVLVRQHDLIGGLVADGGEWEPHVRQAIERAARPDAVAVDAGAYIGLHTITMARCFATVHAFEPQREIYQLLCGNLVLNDCSNVVAHNLALYDRATAMRLAPPDQQEIQVATLGDRVDYAHVSNAAALTFAAVADGENTTPALALDDLQLRDVALIKVDTQGADLKVLRGAEATIRRDRPVLLFEWERDLGRQHDTTLEAYQSFAANLDYEISTLQETSPGRQVDFIARPR